MVSMLWEMKFYFQLFCVHFLTSLWGQTGGPLPICYGPERAKVKSVGQVFQLVIIVL